MRIGGTRRPRADRGAEVVEFALVIPLLLVVVSAIIQFAFMMNAQVTITQAAREGARLAALTPLSSTCDQTCVESVVKPKTIGAAPGVTVDPNSIVVTACPATATNPPSDAVVIISYPFNIGAPLLTLDITLHGKAHFPCGG
jgi:Flp pilus assembly protein TadG